jgi:predicted nucleic acid-binding protein
MKVLLDNSVLQRMPRSPRVERAVRDWLQSGGTLCSSPVSVLEAGYSARSAAEHATITRNLTQSLTLLAFSASTAELATQMQTALFKRGRGRAVGVLDLWHAAVAIEQDATLVHYDSDFEVLGSVWPDLRQRWVLPRGTID